MKTITFKTVIIDNFIHVYSEHVYLPLPFFSVSLLPQTPFFFQLVFFLLSCFIFCAGNHGFCVLWLHKTGHSQDSISYNFLKITSFYFFFFFYIINIYSEKTKSCFYKSESALVPHGSQSIFLCRNSK